MPDLPINKVSSQLQISYRLVQYTGQSHLKWSRDQKKPKLSEEVDTIINFITCSKCMHRLSYYKVVKELNLQLKLLRYLEQLRNEAILDAKLMKY
jgi:hypothetical protein